MNPELSFDQPIFYVILVKGRLDQKWANWFAGFEINYASDNTLLQGFIPDQAALFGILSALRDLGVPLLSVNTLSADDVREIE